PMQRIEHAMLAILRFWLHRSTRQPLSGNFGIPTISSLQAPMSNGGVQRHPSGGRTDGRQRVAKRAQAGESLRCPTRRCPRSGRPPAAAPRRGGSQTPPLTQIQKRRARWRHGTLAPKRRAPCPRSGCRPTPLARRTILTGATLGVGADLVSTLTARAQTSGAAVAQPSEDAIWERGTLGQERRR